MDQNGTLGFRYFDGSTWTLTHFHIYSFVSAMLSENAKGPTLFRSWSNADQDRSTIVQAAWATTRAPLFFNVVEHNNPVKYVVEEAKSLFPGRPISCVLSLGTGTAEVISLGQPDAFQNMLPQNLIGLLKMADECEEQSNAMEMQLRQKDNPDIYFRLNVDEGLQNVPLAEWDALDDVSAHTLRYLEKPDVEQKVDRLVQILKGTSKSDLAFPTFINHDYIISPSGEPEPTSSPLPAFRSLAPKEDVDLVFSAMPEPPSITARHKLPATSTEDNDTVPSAAPEPSSIVTPLSRLAVTSTVKGDDLVPSAVPEPASITFPLDRFLETSTIVKGEGDSVPSAVPEPPSTTLALHRLPATAEKTGFVLSQVAPVMAPLTTTALPRMMQSTAPMIIRDGSPDSRRSRSRRSSRHWRSDEARPPQAEHPQLYMATPPPTIVVLPHAPVIPQTQRPLPSQQRYRSPRRSYSSERHRRHKYSSYSPEQRPRRSPSYSDRDSRRDRYRERSPSYPSRRPSSHGSRRSSVSRPPTDIAESPPTRYHRTPPPTHHTYTGHDQASDIPTSRPRNRSFGPESPDRYRYPGRRPATRHRDDSRPPRDRSPIASPPYAYSDRSPPPPPPRRYETPVVHEPFPYPLSHRPPESEEPTTPERPAASPTRPSVTPELRYPPIEDPREQIDALNRAADRLQMAVVAAEEAEDRREGEYRQHEEDRMRLFLDHEARRNEEARQRNDAIWRELESRLAALPPAPAAAPIPEEPTSEAVEMESDKSAAQRASGHASDVMDHRIKALEDELGRLRADFDKERQQRLRTQLASLFLILIIVWFNVRTLT